MLLKCPVLAVESIGSQTIINNYNNGVLVKPIIENMTKKIISILNEDTNYLVKNAENTVNDYLASQIMQKIYKIL